MKAAIMALLLGVVQIQAITIYFEDTSLPANDRPAGSVEIPLLNPGNFFTDEHIVHGHNWTGNLGEVYGIISPTDTSILFPWHGGPEGTKYKIYTALPSEFGKQSWTSRPEAFADWAIKYSAYINNQGAIPTPEGGSTLLMLAGAALGLLAIKRRPAIAAAALLAVPCQAATFVVLSGFAPGENPLVDADASVNGTWHGDIVQDPGGFQRIGSLGFADSSGIAYVDSFTPFDGSRPGAPNESRVWFELTARAVTLDHKWRITIYDDQGRTAIRDIDPISTSFMQYALGNFTESPGFDYSTISQFSIGGIGGNDPFQADFDRMVAVPEPAAFGTAAALCLLTFGAAKRMNRP